MANLAEGTNCGIAKGSGIFADIGQRGRCIVVCVCQKLLCSLEQNAVAWGEDAIIAHFVKAGGKNMLQEPADEFFSRKSHGSPGLLARVFVAELNLAMIDGKDTAVGNGYPVDIASKIAQYFVGTLDRGFAVDHPLFLPDGAGKPHMRQRLSCKLHELCAEDQGESGHRHQVVFSARQPSRATG